MLLYTLLLATTATAFWPTMDNFRPFGPGFNSGAYPQDFNVVGPPLEAVHDSQTPPTGLAVDNSHNIYLTYPRNMGQTPVNVVLCTGFNEEKPWPNAAIQNCTDGQDPSTCFVNVQNVVLDSIGQMWVVDSGFPYDAEDGSNALYGGSKIMSFNETTGDHIRTYVVPKKLLADEFNANDVRINNTLGTNGHAYVFLEKLKALLLRLFCSALWFNSATEQLLLHFLVD